MAQRALSIPLFDADNHLYETRDALTKYLPERYMGAIDYELTGLDEESVRKIMGGNLARLMNVADVAVR
jgi:hypothetical protein